MHRYVALFKLTEQGIKDIKGAPRRIEESVSGMEAMGGKLIDFYMVLGDYDYVAISEWPSEEAAMTFLLALGSQGNIRTTTLKAFDRGQFTELVSKLP